MTVDQSSQLIIVNERICLDNIRDQDCERLVILANDLDMRKNVGDDMPYPYTQEDAIWRIAHSQSLVDSLEKRQYGIYIDNQYAGNMGREQKLKGRESHNYHFGYRLGRPYWGQGHMTNIVAVFVEHMFQTIPNCHRIYSAVFSRNIGSCRVLEKNGFCKEGEFKESVEWEGKRYDSVIYAKLRYGETDKI